jgi:hypothetical protein
MSRTLVISQRQLWNAPWFSYCVEYETALADILDATTVCISARQGRMADLLRNRYRLRTELSSRLPSVHMVQPYMLPRPSQRFDLGVIVVNDLQQLGVLGSIPGWRQLADRFVAIVVEVWPNWLEAAKPALEQVASQFAGVFTTIESSVAGLGAMSGAPTHFLPPGTDTLFVTPPSSALGRYISVSNRGRRDAAQHRGLSRWAASTDHVYEFDTGSLSGVEDHAVHRQHYLEQCARSRVYITNFARFDQPAIRGQSEELGLRYFEGLASGCVLAGQHPRDDRVHRLLGDEAQIFDFPLGGGDVPADLLALIGDDSAATGACQTNRALALRQHDVLHRWDVIAGILELPVTEGGERRRERLRASHAALVA